MKKAMELDIFLQEQNIKRYRILIDSSTSPTERQTILRLLAEEMDKLKAASKKSGDQFARPVRSMNSVAP